MRVGSALPDSTARRASTFKVNWAWEARFMLSISSYAKLEPRDPTAAMATRYQQPNQIRVMI